MQKKLNKIAKDTNIFLKKFIKKQKKSELIITYEIWFIFRWKKNKIKNFN